MRANASFNFDDGISTSSWNAVFAFRRRVSMSAIGSVIMSANPSPTRGSSCAPSPRCLRHAGDLACVHHHSEADTAQAEPLVHRAGATAPAAPRIGAHLELRCALLLLDECFLCHSPLLRFATRSRRDGTGTPGLARVLVPGRQWCPS